MRFQNFDMGSGTNAADWLGTAMTAAKVAARHISDARDGVDGSVWMPELRRRADLLDAAEHELRAALNEVQAVRLAVRNAQRRETAATQAMVADMERDGLL